MNKDAFLNNEYGIDKSYIFKWKQLLVKISEKVENNEGAKYILYHGGEIALPKPVEQELITTINNFRAAQLPIIGPMVQILSLQIANK